MIKELAGEYVKRRMDELGHKDNYYLRFRHLILQPNERKEIDAANQFYLLIEAVDNVNIASDLGLFDLSYDKADELQYEHEGLISIHNYASSLTHIRFIQVIPKLKSTN